MKHTENKLYLKLKIDSLFEFAAKGDKDTVLDLFYKAFEAYTNTYLVTEKVKAEEIAPSRVQEEKPKAKPNCKPYIEAKRIKIEDDPANETEEPEETEAPEETIEESAAPAKEKLDHGKIGALHKAGWDAKKIADEMHCSVNTVYNVIGKLRKENKL